MGESGMIDSWMEFCSTEIDVPMCTLTYPKLGYFESVPAAAAQAKVDIKAALGILEKHLLVNTYMVGHQITAADISVMMTLYDGFRLEFDNTFRKEFPNVMRWFDLIAHQPAVVAVLGEVKLLDAGAGNKGGNNKKDAK